MKLKTIYILTILVLLSGFFSLAQQQKPSFYLDDDRMILVLDLKAPTKSIDSLLKVAGINKGSVNDIIAGKYKDLYAEKWIVNKAPNQFLIVSRSLHDLSLLKGNNLLEILDNILRPDGESGTPGYPGDVIYGVNATGLLIKELDNGETVFNLRGFDDAKTILISGNFNNWSTSRTKMVKTNNGWVVNLKLEPGKYYYKFIINGKWVNDPQNPKTESDGFGGKNSVYYRCNYTFKLNSNTDANAIVVSGSFNKWNDKELTMLKNKSGWESPIYLREGTHQYKFKINETWITDTSNPLKTPNENGSFNSVINIGVPTVFSLNAYQDAKKVYLSGSFNNWNPTELLMTKKNNQWVLPYVLPAGNYNYKFIVDGKWITDPNNKHQSGINEETNSFISVKPNYTFKLKAYPQARMVRLAGTFNNWDDYGYSLKKVNDEWQISLHLKKGKHLYKFIVDRNWILDPGNKLYENNEFNTGNSILWIE